MPARLVGGAELLGAIGLVLPAAAGIGTVPTPTAEAGLALLTLLAAFAHLRRGQARTAVVSWWRYRLYSW